MPSFDIVSKVDTHEISNTVDQANREVANRFDFKGTDAHFELNENTVKLIAENEFQLQQMMDIFTSKCAKRQIDIQSLDIKDPEVALHQARQEVIIKQGIATEIGKNIIKFLKEKKLKVQGGIQGEQVRVTGKKRDDLQEAIGLLRKEDFKLPLQFENFRD